MKRPTYLILTALLSFTFKGYSQLLAGEVEYRYKIFYDKIYTSQSFISPQERDRTLLTWNNQEGYSTRMKLQFSPEKSIYTYGEPYDIGNYSWRNEEFMIENDLQNKAFLKLTEAMGKTFIIRDEMQPVKWRVMNELREILGHMCMKAVTTDTLKKQEIVAWFAADIPVSTGPEELYGLPGLILRYEVNGDQLIVEAEKITPGVPADPVKLPKKLKGKEVNQAQFDDEVAKFIQSAEKSQRSWVWELRF